MGAVHTHRNLSRFYLGRSRRPCCYGRVQITALTAQALVDSEPTASPSLIATLTSDNGEDESDYIEVEIVKSCTLCTFDSCEQKKITRQLTTYEPLSEKMFSFPCLVPPKSDVEILATQCKEVP